MNNISSIQNKKKSIGTKYIYPLLYQKKKNNAKKAVSSKKVKRFNLNKSKDSYEEREMLKNDNNENKLKLSIQLKQETSFIYLVQYAREKIKKEFQSPYIERLVKNKNFNYVKEDEMPIYYCLYKINDIFLYKRSRFSINFYESNIYYCENEYLIKNFKKYEYIIIMRYLLGYAYDKDFYSHYSKEEFKHKTTVVKEKFQYLVNNNFIVNNLDENEGNINNEIFKNSYKHKNIYDLFFQNNINKNALKQKSLIFLSEYSKLKLEKIRENSFLKNPKYFFVKDTPKEKIPNAIPNYYSLGYFVLTLIKKFRIKNKFKIYGTIRPKKIEKKLSNIDASESSFEMIDRNKKKKKLKDDDDSSISLTESQSEKFLDEIYLDTSRNENDLYMKAISKKITKRYSLKTKNNLVEKIEIKDNDIIDVENLIQNIEYKKQKKYVEKRPSVSSYNRKKKLVKKTNLKSKFSGYQIINTDNFQLKNLYDENANIIIRTFSKKLSKIYNQIDDTPKFILGNPNINSFSTTNSILNNPQMIRNNKYFLTSTTLRKKINAKFLDRKNTRNYLSNVSNIFKNKELYKSSKNNTYQFFLNNENTKTKLSPSKLSSKKINKKNDNNKYFNTDYNENKKIVYPNNFKSKGEIKKQRKINFSIFHNYIKKEFKETKDFITGIKKMFRSKKHQKELIKDLISNFVERRQKRNKAKNSFTSNNNFPELNKYRFNTASNSKKYRINISGNSSKNSRILNQKEILRDFINLNGIFNHQKINL